MLGHCRLYDDWSSEQERIQRICHLCSITWWTFDNTWACCPSVCNNDVKGYIIVLYNYLAISNSLWNLYFSSEIYPWFRWLSILSLHILLHPWAHTLWLVTRLVLLTLVILVNIFHTQLIFWKLMAICVDNSRSWFKHCACVLYGVNLYLRLHSRLCLN